MLPSFPPPAIRPGRWILTTVTLALTALQLHAAPVTLVAGGGADVEGPATGCRLRTPFGTEFAPDGSLWIVEMTGGERVLRIGTNGLLSVAAGTGARGFAGDSGPARSAVFDGIHNLALDHAGRVYLADTWNRRVRLLDPATSRVTTFAGTGRKGFAGDAGPAASAEFGSVIQISFDPRTNALLVADIDNFRIRRINLPDGIVSTVAGNGKKGVPVDGQPALEQPLVDPRAAVADGAGGFYILERGGNALRHVDPAGRIRTVAGTGRPGSGGDGGPALQASLRGPKHLCLDRDGGVIIADTDNHLIRKYQPADGRIVRVAGTGRKGSGGVGGPARSVELNQPHGVTLAPDGSLLVTDSYNHRVLRVPREW